MHDAPALDTARLRLVLRLVIDLEKLPTTNSINRTNRAGFRTGAAETKKVRNELYQEVLDWLQVNNHSTYYDASYRRRGSREITPLLRAETPLINKWARVDFNIYNSRRDTDGVYIKPVLDALEDARIYDNDRKVIEIMLRRVMTRDSQGPRIVLLLYDIE